MPNGGQLLQTSSTRNIEKIICHKHLKTEKVCVCVLCEEMDDKNSSTRTWKSPPSHFHQ